VVVVSLSGREELRLRTVDSNSLFMLTDFVQDTPDHEPPVLACPLGKQCELERVPSTSLVECRPQDYDSCGGAIHYGGIVYCRILFDRLEATKAGS